MKYIAGLSQKQPSNSRFVNVRLDASFSESYLSNDNVCELWPGLSGQMSELRLVNLIFN